MNAPPPLNAFTVDLEEWFQGLTSTNPLIDRWPLFESRIIPTTRLLLDILGTHQTQATFFVLGYIADRYPALVEQIMAEGHEIGVHGYFHRYVFRLKPAEFAADLDRALQAIEPLTGHRPAGHRAPYFSINAQTPWVFEILQSRGFRYDSSVFPVRSLLYAFPEAPRFPYCPNDHSLVEFPISTIRWGRINWPVGGGLYLRTLPYRFIHRAISGLNRQGYPAVIYTHPWELDLDYFYPHVTLRERFTHYHGRAGLAGKLHRLLANFRFGPLWRLLEPEGNRQQ